MSLDWDKIRGQSNKSTIRWDRIKGSLPVTSAVEKKPKLTPNVDFVLNLDTPGVADTTPVSVWKEREEAAAKRKKEAEEKTAKEALRGKATPEFEAALNKTTKPDKLALSGNKFFDSLVLQTGLTVHKLEIEAAKTSPLEALGYYAGIALPTTGRVPGEVISSLGKPKITTKPKPANIDYKKLPAKARVVRENKPDEIKRFSIEEAVTKYSPPAGVPQKYGLNNKDKVNADFIDFLNRDAAKRAPVKLPPKRRIEIAKQVKTGFEIPEETKFKYLQRQLQDKMNRLETVIESIKDTGKKVPDYMDAYLKQELYIGRASERIDQFNMKMIRGPIKGTSFLERLTKDGISIDEMGEFLHAKHAKERNARVAQINKDLPDAGSGLSNRAADEIMEKYRDAGRYGKLDQYAKEFYREVTEKALKIREEAGLISKETKKLLQDTYKNYVPLKVASEARLGRILGKGFSTSSGIKRAHGSVKQRNNPLIQAILDYEDAVIQAEKNRVGQSFLKLIEKNPNPNLWEVENLKFTPRYDKFGEILRMDPRFKTADNVMSVMADGKMKLVTIHDKALAQAMKNIGAERAIPLLQKFNSYIRAVATFYNPEFIISNLQRDLQTAMTHLAGEQGAKMARQTLKDLPKAMRGIYQNVRGKTDGEWANVYQEMKEAGGRVGWFDIKSIDDKIAAVEKTLNRYNSDNTADKLASMVDNVGRFVSDINEVVESGVRLSAYRNARAAGMSAERAAQLAKNLTVNFNKKGNWGVALNSFYLFANAGIQGTARILLSLAKSKTTRKIAAGIAASAFGINQMNRAINEEEFDRIDPYLKDHYWIFMFPNGNYAKIKLPYGYNIFKVMGDLAEQTMMQKIKPAEAGKRLLLAVNDAFNPLSSGSLIQTVMPTAADPVVQHIENKNFFGAPIRPEQPQFGPKVKDSSLFFQSVRKPSKAITDWLNRLTGGTDLEAGTIDLSPEIIDHYIDFLSGGTGKFIANTIETGVSFGKRDMPEPENMPFIRQLIGTPSENYEKQRLYDMADEAGRRHYSDEEIADFMDTVKEAYQRGQITLKQAKKTADEFLNAQSKLQGERLRQDSEGLDTYEDRGDFLDNLSPFEKQLFGDALKQRFRRESKEGQY